MPKYIEILLQKSDKCTLKKIAKKKVLSYDKTYKYTFTPHIFYHVKFLLSSRIDFLRFLWQSRKAYIGKELVEWVLEDHLDVRVQIQLHKILEVQ